MSGPSMFVKRPVQIEAWRLLANDFDEVAEWCHGRINNVTRSVVQRPGWASSGGKVIAGSISIETLEGEMRASLGDWIIRGVWGEFYPCRADIFEQTYERVEVTP